MMKTEHPKNVIKNLQFLRAIAAAMVVAHHARDGLIPVYPEAARNVVGAAGVDIFFVLSGVVITLAAQKHDRTPLTFVMRRLLRVVPMYWLALSTVGLMLVAGLSPLGVQPSDANMVKMVHSMLFVPFERAHGAVMPLLGVGWTLNFEVFFYVLFAGVMVLAPNRLVTVLVAVMGLLVGAGFMLHPAGVWSSFYTNPLLLEFAAGVVLARLWSGPKRAYDAAAGAGLLGMGIILLAWHMQYDGFTQLMASRVFVFGLPAMLCVAGAMLLERAGIAIKAGLAMLLGAASYTLYLFHPIVLQCLSVLGEAIGLSTERAPDVLGMAVVGFVLSHVVAVVLHLHVEKPLTALLRGDKQMTRAV